MSSFNALRSFSAPLRRSVAVAGSASRFAPATSAPALRRYASTFYNADVAGLTEDQMELRDAVSSFVAAELTPEKAASIDRENQSPAGIWEKFGDMGLLGITVPKNSVA